MTAFIWTLVKEKPYCILRFNHTSSGVYIIRCGKSRHSHFSLHRDGSAHMRMGKRKRNSDEFKLPPVADLEIHLMQSQWRSVGPDVIRGEGDPIPWPEKAAPGIFVDPELFGRGKQLVIEAFVYDPKMKTQFQQHLFQAAPHRGHLERLSLAEFDLHHLQKLFGVVVYRAHFDTEGVGSLVAAQSAFLRQCRD
jgi:hypothetical protein